jgi:predicted nucleic acid-binding protein
LTAEITIIEVASALFRKERDGEITVVDRNDALSDFLFDCSEQYIVIQLDRRILIQAIQLFYRHPLRAYDAVQFATAIESNQTLIANSMPALTFVCADRRLCNFAATEGLVVENPNNYL